MQSNSGARAASEGGRQRVALAVCRLHRATLVIAKLDRHSLNVHFVSNLMESGVEFVAVDFPQANKLTIHIIAAARNMGSSPPTSSRRKRGGLSGCSASLPF